jgi:hypothetical protein
MHFRSEGLGSSDPAGVTAPEGDPGDPAGVLDGSQGEGVVGLLGLDPKIGSDGPEASDRAEVGDLPRVQGTAADGAG